MFLDPIDKQRLRNPLITKCGHCFSEHSIHEHLQERNACPLCRAPILPDELYSHFTLRDAVDTFFNLLEEAETPDQQKPARKSNSKHLRRQLSKKRSATLITNRDTLQQNAPQQPPPTVLVEAVSSDETFSHSGSTLSSSLSSSSLEGDLSMDSSLALSATLSLSGDRSDRVSSVDLSAISLENVSTTEQDVEEIQLDLAEVEPAASSRQARREFGSKQRDRRRRRGFFARLFSCGRQED
mmetsp:Transcript_6593/g.20043  ORF Transcript_6593/g.20043 Transcript_6593/m.20043 type:complete len:240 (-) Transcript_6593:79-798(-)